MYSLPTVIVQSFAGSLYLKTVSIGRHLLHFKRSIGFHFGTGRQLVPIDRLNAVTRPGHRSLWPLLIRIEPNTNLGPVNPLAIVHTKLTSNVSIREGYDPQSIDVSIGDLDDRVSSNCAGRSSTTKSQ